MAYSVDGKKAKAFALKAHEGQLDKAGKPYKGHLTRVAARLKGQPEAAVVAWLHDTLEDTDVTAAVLEAQFGPETTAAVAALTHRSGEDYMDYARRAAMNPSAGWSRSAI